MTRPAVARQRADAFGNEALWVLSKLQDLGGDIAKYISIECPDTRDEDAVEYRKQQQWVFGRLTERFSFFDEQTCLLYSGLGFRRSISFDVDQRG